MTLKADNKGRTEEVDFTDINLFFPSKDIIKKMKLTKLWKIFVNQNTH